MRDFSKPTGRIALKVILLCAVLLVVALALVFAQRRRVVGPPTPNQPVGSAGARTINVGPRDSLQRILDESSPGDTIMLQAGVRFVGPFNLPVKPGGSFITIQSSKLESMPAGQRVLPSQTQFMPRIVSAGLSEPAIKTAPGAHHYRLVGLEITSDDSKAVIYDLIRLGDGSEAQNSLAKVPHDLEVDRCYIHARPDHSVKRGIALNSSATSITNSYIEGFKVEGQDSQAIGGWSGPGPFLIENNYLEAAGENILFGGATSAIPGLIPSDIIIRRNHFVKPVSWRAESPTFEGTRWTVKNLFEIKNGRRIKIEGNVFENNWAHAQAGFAILFTCINDSGAWARIEDVDFANNLVRSSGGGVNIRGMDDSGCRLSRLSIRNNLFVDLSTAWGGVGAFLQVLRGTLDVKVDHNTADNQGHVIIADGEPHERFVFTNNIARHNLYGVFGSGSSAGNPTLRQYFPGADFRGNVIVGADAQSYPPNNLYPAPPATRPLLLADLLSLGERYRGRSTDGKNPGCDLSVLQSVLGEALK